jgi:hypothetical protein
MDSINNDSTLPVNRGIELVLKRRTPNKKTFSICFERVVIFFKRKITIYFNFSLNVGKPK